LDIAHLAGRMPSHLSGGEKQRVALARALVVEPRALLFDEPLAALDVASKQAVRAWLALKLRELGVVAVVVTHDIDDALALGEQIAVLENGRVMQFGSWQEIVARPATPFIHKFANTPPTAQPHQAAPLLSRCQSVAHANLI
jgi:molybdate transport system ATP-binding protein